MKHLLTIALLLVLSSLEMVSSASAHEKAFAKTAPGEIEIKTIPASKLIKTQGEGNYFRRSNQLFGRLFNYIDANKVSMTTPVKADIEPAAMYFYIGGEDLKKDLKSTDRVIVIEEAARAVASIGDNGAYTESKFEEAKAKLLDYLASKPEFKIIGEPYAVYWDSPFKLWFRKTFEVHIPVEGASK